MGRNAGFNAPPGWPEPPEDWQPELGWRPDPSWPVPPEGWVYWHQTAEPSSASMQPGPENLSGTMGLQNRLPQARKTTYQRLWVIGYWAVAALNVIVLVLAITGSGVPIQALVAVWLGTLASIGGMLMASDLMHRGVSDRDFDDATKVMRIMVVAWVLLAVSIIVAVVIGTDGGNQAEVAPEAEQALLDLSNQVAAQLFGAAAFFIIIGDEYTKYRRLVTESKSDR